MTPSPETNSRLGGQHCETSSREPRCGAGGEPEGRLAFGLVAAPTRRCLLQALALGAAGCSRKTEPEPRPLVSITRAPEYNNALYDTMRRLLAEHRLDVRGKRVLLKPNLVEFDPGTSINTHPLFVHAVLEAFRFLGASEVRIAEGPGHRRITLDLAGAAGYFSTIPDFERLFTDFNLDEVSEVTISRPVSKLRSLCLPKTALAADLLVSLPKMKTHHWVGATLSMKNFFGLVPGAVYGWPKNILHWAGINECIADIHRLLPPHFAIVDGIEGMEGNGPIQGRPKRAGVVVAGRDLVAVDATACRIMAIDPTRIHYLKLAEDRAQTTEAGVHCAGEAIAAVRTPFALIPEFRSIRMETSTQGPGRVGG